MTITLTTASAINQMESDEPFVMLYEFEVPDVTPSNPPSRLRLCNYTEDIEYGQATDGTPIVYYRWPIVHGGITTNAKGDLSDIDVAVAYDDGSIVRDILERTRGLLGQRAVIRVVNTQELANPQPAARFDMEIVGCEPRADDQTVQFSLSYDDLTRKMIPSWPYSRVHCRFGFGGAECGYVIPASPGEAIGLGFSTCSKLVEACIERGLDEAARGIEVQHPKRWGGHRSLRSESVLG